jgi:hypothetical protein
VSSPRLDPPLHPLPDLSGLSDAELFALREPPGPLLPEPAAADAIEALAARLGPRDLLALGRVALARSELHERRGDHALAVRVVAEYLAQVEPLHPKLNMVAYAPLAVRLYARLGDLLLEGDGGATRAADPDLRIMALGALRKAPPFTMLLAASRIVRGAALRFLEVSDARQLRHVSYGTRLFRFAIEAAYDSTTADFQTIRVGPDAFELQRTHFFEEIAREAAVVGEALRALNERLAQAKG